MIRGCICMLKPRSRILLPLYLLLMSTLNKGNVHSERFPEVTVKYASRKQVFCSRASNSVTREMLGMCFALHVFLSLILLTWLCFVDEFNMLSTSQRLQMKMSLCGYIRHIYMMSLSSLVN